MRKQLLFSLLSLIVVLGFILWWTMQKTDVEDFRPASLEKNGGLVPAEETPDSPPPPTTASPSLDLSNQGLTKVPEYVFKRTDLVILNLSGNKLTGALQAEVRNLGGLKHLDLSDNDFTGVPAEIGQLKNLETLDLSNNQLTGLPYELGNLANLKTLNLRGNAYSEADLSIIKSSLSPSVTIEVD